MMFFLGGIFKTIFFIDVLASIPLMLLSFYGIYYAVDRLNLYRYPILLFVGLSLPNFAVWTSIHSKEAVACFFCGVLAVMIIRFLNEDFKIRFIYLIALYFCLLFKPQYLLFIAQALVFLRLIAFFKMGPTATFLLGVIMFTLNLVGVYLLRDLIDTLAQGMYLHFTYKDPEMAKSTRSADPWLEQYGFFKQAPYGMFIAFWGPTVKEMVSKPVQLIAGIESGFLLLLFMLLCYKRLTYFLNKGLFNPRIYFALGIIIVGILFVHYPFGFLNPGSGIRYRANFYLLFLLMLFYLFDMNAISRIIKNKI
ncbi:hypothetical protein ACFSQ6_06295 [Sphingobacterium populi]|uniref:Glycosyltransferase RgtA/B/C/D-like domain-containing protein n=2 Tax=Sphingobacterium populi TaxID=1812824 RepID=A0ABW5UC95_9SPHI